MYRSIIFAFLFVLACGGGAAYVLRGMLGAQDAYRKAREATAELEGRVQRTGALAERWERVAPKAEMIDQAFLGRDSIQRFFEQVEATAQAAGVTEKISIVRKAGIEGVKGTSPEVTFNLHATGPFASLFVFVTHLSVLPTLIFIEEVSFTATGGEAETRAAGSSAEAAMPSVDVIVRVPLKGAGTPEPTPTPLPAPPSGKESGERDMLSD